MEKINTFDIDGQQVTLEDLISTFKQTKNKSIKCF